MDIVLRGVARHDQILQYANQVGHKLGVKKKGHLLKNHDAHV